MVESDNDIPKITPDDDEKGGVLPGDSVQEDTQLVLVSKDLPDRIFLLPAGPKPVCPGMLFPLLVAFVASPSVIWYSTIKSPRSPKINFRRRNASRGRFSQCQWRSKI